MPANFALTFVTTMKIVNALGVEPGKLATRCLGLVMKESLNVLLPVKAITIVALVDVVSEHSAAHGPKRVLTQPSPIVHLRVVGMMTASYVELATLVASRPQPHKQEFVGSLVQGRVLLRVKLLPTALPMDVERSFIVTML